VPLIAGRALGWFGRQLFGAGFDDKDVVIGECVGLAGVGLVVALPDGDLATSQPGFVVSCLARSDWRRVGGDWSLLELNHERYAAEQAAKPVKAAKSTESETLF
jgi:hypothetical protein